MRVIGVIDVAAGGAVHAQGGNRAGYRPISECAGTAIEPGAPDAVARAYLERRVSELYVADLDAIGGSGLQSEVLARLAVMAPVWMDCGVATVARAIEIANLGPRSIIVGLETLDSMVALGEICRALGSDRIAFSLDLRDRRPMTPFRSSSSPEALAAQAMDSGVHAVIVLDLARVGSGRGPDFDLLSHVRRAVPDVLLVAGGGVRDARDLGRLAECGCDGALVATALLTGRLTAMDVEHAAGHYPNARV